MKRNLIASLLAACLLATALGGCADNSAGTTVPDTSSGAPTTTTTTTSAGGELPFANGETITIGLNQSANVENYDTNQYTQWLEEQTGLNLEFSYFSSDATEAATQLSLMIFSGQKLPDVIWAFAGLKPAVSNEYGQDGYFIDLKDYFYEYGHYFWERQKLLDTVAQESLFALGTDQSNGAMYAFPTYQESAGDRRASMTYINGEWLGNLNLTMPTNTDELRDVLIAFRDKDPNKNGIADEIPMIGGTTRYRADIVSWLLNSFVYMNDMYFFTAKDGALNVPYTTDEYREGLRYVNSLVEDGLLSTLTWTISEDSELTAIVTPANKIAIAGVVGMHTSMNLENNNPVGLQYTGLTGISSPNCAGYAPLNSDSYVYTTFITADCETPELAFKLLDFMSSKESFNRMRNGELGVDWEYAAPGTDSGFGVDAAYNRINNVFGNQNNKTWNSIGATFALYRQEPPAFNDDGSWGSDRTKISNNMLIDYDAQAKANNPPEVVYDIVYTSDEMKSIQEISVTILDYVQEARAKFAAGVLDIDNDSDWNSYLKNLESMGLDTYLKTAQAAYTRQNG